MLALILLLFSVCTLVVLVLSDGPFPLSSVAEMLAVGTASLLDNLDGGIADFGTACLITEYTPHALKPLLSVLTVAAIPYASAKNFPNISFVMPFPE